MKTTEGLGISEVCEIYLNGITVPTFKRQKAKYMTILEQEFHVKIEVGARNKQFFFFTPKETEVAILRDSSLELKNKDLKNIELILKAVLIDKIIPIHDEIIANTGLKESTVKRCIKKMWDNRILIMPEITIMEVTNVYTGEIYSYPKKNCSYIYYDNLLNGKRIKVDYPNIHSAYGEFFDEKLQQLNALHQSNFNRKIGLNVSGFHAWKEVNLRFHLHDGNRTEKWVVSSEYKQLIMKKYSHR